MILIPDESIANLMQALNQDGSIPKDPAGLLDLAVERIRSADTWKCFHCGFETSNEADAAAHFGDMDDVTPLCRTWEQMDADGRVSEYQGIAAELNGERERTRQLQSTVEDLEFRVDMQDLDIKSYRPFRDCRTIQDIFNVYDSMEGRALAAEERLAIWEKAGERIDAIRMSRTVHFPSAEIADILAAAHKDIVPGSIKLMAEKIHDLQDRLAQHQQIVQNLAELAKQNGEIRALQADSVARMAPSLIQALESLQTCAEGLERLSHTAFPGADAVSRCPNCNIPYDSPVPGCPICQTKRAAIAASIQTDIQDQMNESTTMD